jgi:hypothetical protein
MNDLMRIGKGEKRKTKKPAIRPIRRFKYKSDTEGKSCFANREIIKLKKRG